MQPLYQPAEQRPPQPRETMPRGGFKLTDSEVPSSHSGSSGPPGPCICESVHPCERPNGETRTEPPQQARTVHWTRALLAVTRPLHSVTVSLLCTLLGVERAERTLLDRCVFRRPPSDSGLFVFPST